MTVRTFDELARAIRAAPPRLGDVRLVTVDGPSGSGKTTFARRLVSALSAQGSVDLVELEELYDGWTLAGAWDRLDRYVLEPIAAGWSGGFHPYDWATESWSPRWTSVPLCEVLVVEGCGSSPRAADAYTSHRIWMETPRSLAVARGLNREGPGYDLRLRTWRRLESAHFAEQDTRRRSDLWVEGHPETQQGYDPETSFRVLD